jgi:5-methylcytosine-specific restriction endonuclease McrA
VKVEIKTIEEYRQIKALQAWLDPLVMPCLFIINKDLRKEIIKLSFPFRSTSNDQKYYHWVWAIKPHWCEECGQPLSEYHAVYISHIRSKGAKTHHRYDPLNSNILCGICHNKWEYGDRNSMYINVVNNSIETYFL